jgi:hypothetical protein
MARHLSTALFDPRLSFDPGASLKQRRDGAFRNVGAAAVVLEDREDIDGTPDHRGNLPVIRGARRCNVLNDLASRGVINKRQHNAANRFLDDCSLASGGGLVADLFAIRGGSSNSFHEALVDQVDAIGRVRRMFRLLDLDGGSVIWWVVFDDQRLGDYDTLHRMREGTASGLFRAALTALDDYYNGSPER